MRLIMSYELTIKRLPNFLGYVNKVYGFSQTISSIQGKAYGSGEHPRSIGGLKIVAVDGTEHFRSECIHCRECMEVNVKTKDGIKTHYFHNIVIMYVVGRLHSSAVQTILGAEPSRPKDVIAGEESGHEGEATAAKRLVEKMIGLYGNGFFDLLTTDAYYSTKPFVEFMDSLGKYLDGE